MTRGLIGLSLLCGLLARAASAQSPLLLRGTFTDAAISVGTSAPADRETLRRLLPENCLGAGVLSADEAAALDAGLARAPWIGDGQMVSVTLFPRLDELPGCVQAPSLRSTLASRGIVLAADSPLDGAITRVDVIVDGRSVDTRDARSIPLAVLPGGQLTEAATAFQFRVPLDAFGISERLGPFDVVFVAWRHGALTGERLELPQNLIRTLWRQALAAHPVVVEDAALAEAAERLPDAPSFSDYDLPVARLADAALLARALVMRGDSFPARVLAHDAIAAEPCTRLESDEPLVARRLFESARPASAYCAARPLSQTALRGALVPGLGQVSSRKRTWLGAAILLVTAERILSSRAARNDSRRLYREYLAADNQGDATRAFDAAQAAWRRSDLAAVTAGTLWVGALAEALWFEWRMGERLRWAAPLALPPFSP